jgi:putative CocE/NonD family hydrolase
MEPRARLVEVPTMIIQGWQDHQTAMGGSRLFQLLKGPKRMLLYNGGHGAFNWAVSRAESIRWMDRWLKDEANGADREPAVTVGFETRIIDGKPKPSWRATFPDWPPPELRWSTFHLTADGRLSSTPVTAQESGTRSYTFPIGTELAGDAVAFANPPSPLGSLAYRTPVLTEDLTLLGPAQLTFWVSTEQKDTDFMVVLHDVGPEGETTFVQKGFLRASHRAVDTSRSTGYQIFQRHDRVEELTPGTVYEIKLSLIEAGHVFRRGHMVELAVMAPSPVPSPDWGPAPLDLPGVNTLHHSTRYPSQLKLPILPGGRAQGEAPKCGELVGSGLFQPCRLPPPPPAVPARGR